MIRNIKNITNRIIVTFATAQELQKRTGYLVELDSLQLNRYCYQLMSSYGKVSKQEMLKNLGTQEKEKAFDHLIEIYKTMSESKVGFLLGDMHAEGIYKIYKFLENKIEKETPEYELVKEDYKKILDSMLDNKAYGIPFKGIQNRQLENKHNLYQRQLILEEISNQHSYQKFTEILNSLVKIDQVHLSEVMRKHTREWFPSFCKAIKDEQGVCRERALEGKRKIYASNLLKLNAEKLASISLSELMRQIANILFRNSNEEDGNTVQEYDGISEKKLIMNIARWVNIQAQYEVEERKFRHQMKVYEQLFQLRSKRIEDGEDPEKVKKQLDLGRKMRHKYIRPEERKQYLNQMIEKLIKNSYRYRNAMSEEVQYEIGALIVYFMKQIVKVRNKYGIKVPLLTQQYTTKRKNKEVTTKVTLKINDFFLHDILPKLEKEGDLHLHLERSLPTLIEPLPWVDYEIGGYYLRSTLIMRFNECKLQERSMKYADLSRVYNVLNYLGKIPWRINKRILGVVQGIWAEGGMKGEIPQRYSEPISTFLTKLRLEKDQKAQKKLKKKIQQLRDQHSLRSDFNFKLNIARSFSRVDRFYFPHNLDFRGRVYPVPPHLNHIGNDLSRGLLAFADGKKLGESGLKWLKIHCANLMGKDKAIISQKLQFIEANLDLIHQIAKEPLKNRLWLKFEDSWQALAAIFQLDQALNSPEPSQFISHLHVHQDGSCNGLQHYAALGRDVEGAYQVNLGPTERPGDVYTHVAKMVIKMLEKDANDDTNQHCQLAKKLQHNIKRKTIKQTVMTSVYGVTFIGAREQIYRQIRDQNFLGDEQQEYAASKYLATLTLAAISNLFERAHLIKKWLIACAKEVSSTNNPVSWITPMGLPVVQPYRSRSNLDTINTIVQNLRLASESEHLPVHKSKQQSAFPPNFVHSLDSTHMMYTTQRCMKEGITFSAVHDSYWTHAGSIESMNTLLREEFIRLHSQPLLERLKESLQKRFPHLKFPPIPSRGDFDLEKIKESVYFFS